MDQEKKYFGMTGMQVGILAGLGLVVCILFAVLGWMVLGGGNLKLPSFSRAPESTPTPQMTPTVFVIPTMTPTSTPTPVPYEQLVPPGWKQFKTELVEIWLPETFKSVKKDAGEEIAMLGGDAKSSFYRMRVSVSYEPLVGNSLDEFVDAGIAKMDPQIRVVERRKVSLNGAEAVRMTFELRIDTVDVNELVYVIQDGGTVWFIFYAAQINEYYNMLPEFEKSALTFRVVR
jgi:hypothetical protein